MRIGVDLEIPDFAVFHALLVEFAVFGFQVGLVFGRERQAQLRQIDFEGFKLRLKQIEVVERQATATVDQFASRHQDRGKLTVLERAPVVRSQGAAATQERIRVAANYALHFVVRHFHLLDVAHDGVLRVERVQHDVLRHVLAGHDADRIGVVVDEHFRLDPGFGQVQGVVLHEGAQVFRFVQEVVLLDGLLFNDVSPYFFVDRHIVLNL